MSEEDAVAIVLFRAEYGMSRREVAELPMWERQLLLGAARARRGLDDDASDDGGLRADGSVDVAKAVLTRSDGG